MSGCRIEKFYSWKDIERVLMSLRDRWEQYAYRITVYRSYIEISLRDEEGKNEILNIMEEVFGDNFVGSEEAIILDLGKEKIPLDFSGEDTTEIEPLAPLFKNRVYKGKEDKSRHDFADGISVLAFHSYKGGVGRTLSLLAFAKAWAELQPSGMKKVLVVDSDIEAPGLTWFQNEEQEQHFSYLDLLEAIHDRRIDETLQEISEQIKSSTLTIRTQNEMIETYFIPAYRYREQLLDIYSKPENIVENTNYEYILPEVLARLAQCLNVSVVLIDLRAGISDYSSPYLFDSRVKKYMVTSTSSQSVEGTKILLEQMMNGNHAEYPVQSLDVLLTMVLETVDPKEIQKIEDDLNSCYDGGNEKKLEEGSSVVTKLPFATELVHLNSLDQIMRVLEPLPFYGAIRQLVKVNYYEKQNQAEIKNRQEVIEKIHRLTDRRITGDAGDGLDILQTQAIRNLKKKYQNEIPRTVIIGTKGSGKTFLYNQMVRYKSWNRFCAYLNNEKSKEDDILFFPVLAGKSITGAEELLKECIRNFNCSIGESRTDENVWLDNNNRIIRYLDEGKHSSTEWLGFWDTFLAKSVSSEMGSLGELNLWLEQKKKKVVFLVDGLEELLKYTLNNVSEQSAVAVLCQDIMMQLRVKMSHIGVVIFMRRDIVKDSIRMNYEQFYNQYQTVELKWTSNEALRLVLWLVREAYPDFYQEDTMIETATQEYVEKQLQRLWGVKLGKPNSKEAYSSSWILKALSDFNGQLQARDIIRFLFFATENVGKDQYPDRYIMPKELREALPNCSRKKIEDIRQEIGAIAPILDKLKNVSGEKKILPFQPEDFDLTIEEEKIMIQEGFLKNVDGGYYLPEILRHALNFKYKGARSRVLSLQN